MGIVIISFYYAILFRHLAAFSDSVSENVLLIVCVVSGEGFLFTDDDHPVINFMMGVIVGCGVYTVLSYWPIAGKLILRVLSASAIVSFIFYLFVKRRGMLKTAVTLALTAVMAVLSLHILFAHTIISPTVQATESSSENGQTIDSNIETLSLLEEVRWETLSPQKKMDVLQTVANIEQQSLGLSDKLDVVTLDLPENTEGSYKDQYKQVAVDADDLLTESAHELVDTVAHEAYHSYEHRLVDSLKLLDDDSVKDSSCLEKAAVYKDEFAHYIGGSEDFYSYYNQECEVDSRSYAAEETERYFSEIYDHLGIEVSCR